MAWYCSIVKFFIFCFSFIWDYISVNLKHLNELVVVPSIQKSLGLDPRNYSGFQGIGPIGVRYTLLSTSSFSTWVSWSLEMVRELGFCYPLCYELTCW